MYEAGIVTLYKHSQKNSHDGNILYLFDMVAINYIRLLSTWLYDNNETEKLNF